MSYGACVHAALWCCIVSQLVWNSATFSVCMAICGDELRVTYIFLGLIRVGLSLCALVVRGLGVGLDALKTGLLMPKNERVNRSENHAVA